MRILLFMLSCALTNNLIFSDLCCCPFMDGATNVKKSAAIGAFTVAAMAVVSAIAGLIHQLVLRPLNVEYLYILALALTVVIVMQIIYVIFKNTKIDLRAELPMTAVSCMLLGIVVGNEAGFVYSVLNSVCAAVGYLAAIVMMAGIRDRLKFSRIPACMKGVPISLVTAGLLALAFMGFTGLH